MKFNLRLSKRIAASVFGFALLFSMFSSAHAGGEPYGAPITLEQAKVAMAKAEETAKKNNWNVIIAIVDPGGHLIMMQRLDSGQHGSIPIAIEKAEAAVAFRRPTAFWQELIAKGGKNLRILNLTGGDAGVLEGGVPIVIDGKVVGGIGVSGVASSNDAIIAQSGVDAIAKK